MDIKFTEDENGRITDSDKLFDKIDGQLDNEEYDEVVSEILSIPREKWSNKLRFRLVNAYSNQKEFDKASKELDEVAALSEAPNDLARCHYSRGYLRFMDDKEIMAREHYRMAAKLDPEYAKEVDLEEDIKECSQIIAEDLAGYHAVCKTVNEQIKERCARNFRKRPISEEGFQMRLGFFPGIRKLPGFEHPLGFEDHSSVYDEQDKAKCLTWFEKFYNITDEESFFRHIRTDRGCNISRMIFDVAAHLTGKPHFDIKELDDGGRFAFETATMFATAFLEYLPKAGVLAWDIGEKIGFARHAYRCGLIGSSEYISGMRALSDQAKNSFSGWEEYMRSLIFGAGLFMFSVEEWSITAAAKFVSSMAPLLVRSDLPDSIWYSAEG